MKCPECQTENPETKKFCRKCGTRLSFLCPQCASEYLPGDEFCGECGHKLIKPKEGPPGAYPKPESYTPKYLAEKILTSRAALEGERKQVTVLFADLKGSTELIAERDPEEARKLLDPVIERMMEAVHHYEGTVTHIMGDGIMALFGAPLAIEDHAVRACYAALRMQEAIRRYDEDLRRSQGIEVQIRVGLNSGEVVVGSIGSDLHMEYTAVGHTTHLAARMEQLAAPGSIRISSETQRLAEGFIEVKSLGPVPVKMLAEPVEVYEVTGGRPGRTRLQAVAARGLTRFVGRDAEMEQLRYALQKAGEGRGEVMAIMGEAGVGKSRLFHEFIYSHRTQGWLILEAASVSYGKATVYFPVTDLLKTYFKIQDRDDHREIRQKVIGKVFALDRALEPTLPAFFALLDVPVEDSEWQAVDPPHRRQRILDAIKRLLLRESQVQPLLVVFEDLHWIDSETQAVLENLVESLPTARILLLVNYRPEYGHAWGSKTYYTQLRIDPLPSESAEELLDALLGPDPGLRPLKRLLVERTEGNPFFLEESVRTLVETKALIGERGAYRLGKPFEGIQVPTTVQAVLAARIDGLPPEEKHLVQTAAVIGKDVPFALIKTIVDQPEEVLRRALTHLQAGEFLYETTLFPDLEYTFKHALTYEVAYRSLLQERRRGLHARIVEAIERLYPDRLAEHIDRLAHHAFRGELWGKAVAYLRQAGVRAFDRSANREAVVCFEQALAALTHLPDTRETLEQGIDVRLALRNSFFPLGGFEAGFEHLRDAERLAKELGDQRRLGWIAAYLSEFARLTGHSADAGPFAERAWTIAEGLGDLPLRVAASYYHGTACFVSGDYRRTDEFFAKILQLLEGDLIRERCGLAGFPAVMSRVFWMLALAERGEFEQGIVQAQEAMRLAETLDHPYSSVLALHAAGCLHDVRGEFDHAIRLAERSLVLSHDRNLPLLSLQVADLLGHLFAQSGRVAEGLSLIQESLTGMESIGMVQWRLPLLVHLGETYLLANRLDDALTTAERGLTLARERGHRGSQAWALRLLGEIASQYRNRNVATPEAHYSTALALASELGMRPLIAHCHLGLGKLYWREGKREQAQDHLTSAAAMYREMGMGFWLEKAEKEKTQVLS